MLLTQLTLGLWILSPIYAVPPTPAANPRKAPAVSRPSAAPARAPAARRVPVPPTKVEAKARKVPVRPTPRIAPPARSSAPANAPGVGAKDILQRLPSEPDTSVNVVALGNGLLSWCQGKKHWNIVEVRVGIAAGSANDPKGLLGRSRFLAHLLRKQLNQPKNPAKSQLPPGGQRYTVTLGKDWVEIRLRSTRKQLPVILAHLANSLHVFHKQPLTATLRSELEKTSGTFPPPQLAERVDAYLFGKQPRGAWLRGKKRTYRSIQPLPLQTAYETLYSPNRMRVLITGGVDCNEVKATLEKSWMVLPRGKKSALYPKASANLSGNSRSMLAPQQLFSLYQLPDLYRRSYVPLQVLQQVALQELSHQMNQKFGTPFAMHSFLQPSAKHGFLVIAIPAQPLSRGKLQKHLKQTLGKLQMQTYLPELDQRVQLYLRATRMQLQQMQESSAGSAELLWPQLLLPPHNKAAAQQPPTQIEPLLKAITPTSIRELALLYMARDFSLSGMGRPFSMQRIALFIGTIILIWLLLDIILRRTRRMEE